MKLYLSSYKIGHEKEKLMAMMPENKKIAYIPNAIDFSEDLERRKESNKEGMNLLKELGFRVFMFDLKKYFGKEELLREKMSEFNAVWVRGGNTFVLRQAMKLSGFDKIITERLKDKKFLYGGYSAGICILAPSIKWLDIVDDPTQNPYNTKIVWEGLNMLDYMIFPHYKSDHPEAKDVDKEVARAKKAGIKYKTLKDGEVIITEL